MDLTSHFSHLWGAGVKEERERNVDKAAVTSEWPVAWPGPWVGGPGPGSHQSREYPEPEPHPPVPVHAAHPSTRATACNKACHWSKSPVYRGREPIRAADTLCLWGQQFCDWVWPGLWLWCIKGAVGERCSQEKDAGLSCSHQQAVETSHSAVQLSDTHHQHSASVQTINVGLDIQHSSLMTSYLSPNKFFPACNCDCVSIASMWEMAWSFLSVD